MPLSLEKNPWKSPASLKVSRLFHFSHFRVFWLKTTTMSVVSKLKHLKQYILWKKNLKNQNKFCNWTQWSQVPFEVLKMAPPTNLQELRGFWGKPTSTLDWCENNYEVKFMIFCENLKFWLVFEKLKIEMFHCVPKLSVNLRWF